MGEPGPDEVVAFWRQAGRERWFAAVPDFDAACRGFLGAHEAGARGDLAAWETQPAGALALVLLLDQFPRNLFRGSPRAYATDPLAREAAARALDRGFDEAVEPALRVFLYMPFMHAEDPALQERSLALFAALGDPDHLAAAREHRALIQRFGRFPHRNAVLGRANTPEETAYLAREDAFRG
ncbi:DUF924 family protein [Methylobacterium sp. JK268]